MKGILAIYRRELQSYFVSPIAYIVISVFLLLCGFFFYDLLNGVIQEGFRRQMSAMQGGMPSQDLDMPGIILSYSLGLVSTFILFMIPMLTMGLFAGERRQGTMELLMTSPVTELQIVLGKFLATLTLFIVMIAPTFLYHVVIRFFSDPKLPWKIILAGYLGTLLLGGALIAIGAWLSSLTENQIIAAFITFGAFIILLIVDRLVRESTGWWGETAQYLSILRHFNDFTRGVIDTTNLIYYLSVIVLGIFLTWRTLDSMRWRRA
ncbi:MAG TPA: ABC transporter permease subunit [Blastocatellia bacterium]|nr:ABC transporter permease subunit [Blastocatellia bacterium]